MPTRLLSRLSPPRRPKGLADIALGAVIVSVVGLMVVPLPTWLLDLLLSANLVAAVSILLVTIYVSDPLKVAAFPTLLLITTLVRLALNVSSTRLILLQADAGRVIQAFGDFVVAGNYVVGAVIFLILSIIQLVVIARGSERVAEVGARFTLDAMPGKQMAIDSEQRAGTLDATGARDKRRALDRASQFYGAMDGAMKFVKGDVIASLLITTINIGGGLAIGIVQRDLPVGDAARIYGLLTIGDGLVTQIPALLLATAAGVLVTRVASETEATALGEDLGRQLLGVPRALRAAAIFVVLLAVVPGLPTWPFLVLGVALVALSFAAPAKGDSEASAPDPVDARFIPVVTPWTLCLPTTATASRDATSRLERAIEGLRETLFFDLGVPVPAPSIELSADVAPGTAALRIRERALGPAIPLLPGGDADPAELVRRIDPLLRQQAKVFLGMSDTQRLLDRLERARPGEVRQVVPKRATLSELTETLRLLLAEQVSIRDLSTILEALASFPTEGRDGVARTEHVRRHLAEQITADVVPEGGALPAVLLDRIVEDTLEEAIVDSTRGRVLALSPATARDITVALETTLKQHPDAVVVTRPETRPFVRRLIDSALPGRRVVSFAELGPSVQLDVRATVRPG